MKLKRLCPMLNVSDIHKSLAFYKDALGFDVVSDKAAVEEWRWATIRSGDTELMLSETGCSPGLVKDIDPQQSVSWPAIYYFYPEDVTALHQHMLNCKFKPTDVKNTIYGMKEFSIQDPDGHMLSFGEDAASSS